MIKYLLALTIISIPAFAKTYGLSEVLELANKQNQQILDSRIQTQSSEVQKSQLTANVLPSISLRHDYTQQDMGNRFIGDTQEQTYLRLTQPLFKGLKEWKALDVAKLGIKASELNERITKIDIHSRLVDVYGRILAMDKFLSLNKDILELATKRVSYLQRRVKIGRSRESELLLAKSQQVSIERNLESLSLQRNLAIGEFSVLLGLDGNMQLSPITIPNKVVSAQYLDQVDNHPMVQLWDIYEQQATKTISMNRADHYPEINLTGNYFLDQSGVFNPQDWNVSVNVVLPLYEGGATVSATKLAMLQEKQAQLQGTLAKRQLKVTLKNFIQQINKTIEQTKKLKEIVSLNQKNYQTLNKEYNLGLVNNLEVIQSLNQYNQSQIDLAQVQIDSAVAYTKLKLLVGEQI